MTQHTCKTVSIKVTIKLQHTQMSITEILQDMIFLTFVSSCSQFKRHEKNTVGINLSWSL